MTSDLDPNRFATHRFDARAERGVDLAFVHEGVGGTPLLLIHGWPETKRIWWKVIEPLAAAGFAVYAFDQPGFGLTENPDDYSLDFRFAHARAFVDKMKIERYHVMGNSMGAYLAARLALEDSRVRRLVLVSSNTLAPKGSPESQAKSKRHAE